jgi:hypothetical protein
MACGDGIFDMRTELSLQILPRSGASLLTSPADDLNGNFVTVPGIASGVILFSFHKSGIVGVTVTIKTNASKDGGLVSGLIVPNRVLTTIANVPFLWVCPLFGADAIYSQDDGTILIDYSAPCSAAAYLMQ